MLSGANLSQDTCLSLSRLACGGTNVHVHAYHLYFVPPRDPHTVHRAAIAVPTRHGRWPRSDSLGTQ